MDSGEKVTQTCAQLVTAQQMYEYNSNFSLDDGWTPAAGSRAATAVGYRGVACSWINDSSSERISLGVAHLRADTLASIEAQRAGGTQTPWGYFTVDGSTGRADAFTDDYWITLDSKTFFEPGDAAQLVEDVVGALG
ncbi:hypothetical protein QT381_10480 [Galbitalea sp. SE-J8]|uniref:hypothetical protein n=1 Tax=Galbitalea sp. SE-J8 TaxID=3054952 RepID=UPI00259D25F5|nr:hypothetical protein [Galbitalea sp. SE-J8]MDM4763435.1 hypothetical protein [Galbitalea sp. SE-J8]